MECSISKGETGPPEELLVSLKVAVPGRFMTWIWAGRDKRGSIGCGRLRSATAAAVVEEKDISAESE